ncbi:MAG TPA: hypothetical protein VEV83_20170 [Parafilimonas sp.]|nr:hypothetical protein [Parafilimonas sp.]
MCRYNLLFAFTLFSFGGNCQDLFYSAPIGNYAYTEYKIIGRVQHKIIAYTYVWSHTFDRRNSEILIYDDKMQLDHRVSLKPIATKYSSIEFLNEGNSFSAVLQYIEQNSFVCKLVSFDPEGKIVSTRILERSSILNDGPYHIVQSPNTKTFALWNLLASDSNTAITIKYHLIENDTLVHSDQITLPFNRFSSGLDNTILDGRNLIVPVNDNTGSSGVLYLYRVDLTNNSSSKAVRRLTDGYLVSESIRICGHDDKYSIISEWKDRDVENSKVFLWRLNNDLTDVRAATVFNSPDTNNVCLEKMESFNVNIAALKDKTINLILSSRKSIPASAAGRYGYSGAPASTSISSGANGLFYGDGVSYAVENVATNTNYESPDPMTAGAKIEGGTLSIWNIDEQNNIRWVNCFDETIEKDFRSSVNRATIAQSENSLHIIFLKALKNNKQALGHIVLQADGTYKIMPIISMNLDYLYFPRKSLQIDENTVVVPCALNGKLVFGKLKLYESW